MSHEKNKKFKKKSYRRRIVIPDRISSEKICGGNPESLFSSLHPFPIWSFCSSYPSFTTSLHSMCRKEGMHLFKTPSSTVLKIKSTFDISLCIFMRHHHHDSHLLSAFHFLLDFRSSRRWLHIFTKSRAQYRRGMNENMRIEGKERQEDWRRHPSDLCTQTDPSHSSFSLTLYPVTVWITWVKIDRRSIHSTQMTTKNQSKRISGPHHPSPLLLSIKPRDTFHASNESRGDERRPDTRQGWRGKKREGMIKRIWDGAGEMACGSQGPFFEGRADGFRDDWMKREERMK